MSIKRDDLDAGRVDFSEAARGKRGRSFRINDQWRVIFRWIDGEPHEVRIVDYH